ATSTALEAKYARVSGFVLHGVVSGVTPQVVDTWLPCPSSPNLSEPQQPTDPVSKRTQLWSNPSARRATPDSEVGCGVALAWVLRSPSCPTLLLPQHETASTSERAQVCVLPATISMIPSLNISVPPAGPLFP